MASLTCGRCMLSNVTKCSFSCMSCGDSAISLLMTCENFLNPNDCFVLIGLSLFDSLLVPLSRPEIVCYPSFLLL